jgi:2-polyprenyl-3-methyl-5-hydroxy-6-metoxy-1,4-benzoquinol methylase
MPRSQKETLKGIIYVLSHPTQMKWLWVRETQFRDRKTNKVQWVRWQKYDAQLHISMMKDYPVSQTESVLNLHRIEIFTDIASKIGKNLTVLDTGCGDGVISEPLLKLGNFVTSIELPGIIALAPKNRVPYAVAGDIEQLACMSGAFDLVVASEVVEHLWNPESFFAEAYRVLKPEGYLLVETPEGEGSLNYDSHRNFFTVEILEQALAGKFATRRVERLAATGSAQTPTIIVLFQKLKPT